MAGAFCKRANRRGKLGDGYVSAVHPLFVAAADRLRHAAILTETTSARDKPSRSSCSIPVVVAAGNPNTGVRVGGM